jgi:2-polyprenyl-3-methyl-5-hydroxy-6-metoxy-1,4-benzoquinol methylase
MVEEIVTVAKASTYDFRKTAYPEDPLRHLFPEWVSYYRTKWAIAKVLQPSSILEIGVRYGYSALAFLNASPSARYVGIDLDVSSFGGSVGAIDWARKACLEYQAELIIADSTEMDRFPGGRYDLIHVDGQQDEQGTMHDLVRASAQASYILVDGFFWSRSNFLSASEFLFRYRDIIEFYEVVPGYAGELLVKIKESVSSGCQTMETNRKLNNAYIKSYHLADEVYNRTIGLELEDLRRDAVANLAGAAALKRVLELGCGCGELSLELARRGFEVTAIGNSEDALGVAREAISHNPGLSSSITLECNDVNSVDIRWQYGVAVAADLLEHMKYAELDELYQRTAKHLAPDGLFIVHTYPNRWYYRYEYARRQRLARQIGAYLPVEPRTRYELLMHINEQSPRILRRQLSKYFRHVLVWFGTPMQPAENLRRKFLISEMRAATDLFAVASHQPIPVAQLLRQLCMEAVAESDRKKIELIVNSRPAEVRPGSRFFLAVEVHNRTDIYLKSVGPYPVHLSYHWLSPNGQYVVFDGERTRLVPGARPDSAVVYQLTVTSPDTPGMYVLRVTLVQESIAWFDLASGGVCEMKISCAEAVTPLQK